MNIQVCFPKISASGVKIRKIPLQAVNLLLVDNGYFCRMTSPHSATISKFLKSVCINLEQLYPPREAGQLAMILLEHYSGVSKISLMTEPNAPITDHTMQLVEDAVTRLLNHEPVQYITGIAYFYGYRFHVTPSVLIPRPETEELVQWIIQDYAGQAKLQICDIGTGSGCIAIALRLKLHDAEVDAYDISQDALEIAKKNSEELGAEVFFYKNDILAHENWPTRQFDVIVSNPPYIPRRNMSLLARNVVDFETPDALFVPDHDPLLFYRSIAAFSAPRLKPHGKLYVEVHEDYAAEVAGLFEKSELKDVMLRTDLNEKKRMVRAGALSISSCADRR